MQKSLIINKVDESLRREYAEQISIINNEAHNVSSSQNLVSNKINLQGLAAIYARQPGNIATAGEQNSANSSTSNFFTLKCHFLL